MAYCCQCGKAVTERDLFCAVCGAKQPNAAGPTTPPPRTASQSDFNPKTASVLCYIPFVGWVAAIVVLATDRFRSHRTVRFHAFQGLYLFVAWLIVTWVIQPFSHAMNGPYTHIHLEKILELGLLAVWVFMIVKTSQEQVVSLPIIGEMAERSVSES